MFVCLQFHDDKTKEVITNKYDSHTVRERTMNLLEQVSLAAEQLR